MSFARELDLLLSSGKDLPTIPEVVLQLRSALDDDAMGDADIAEIIYQDPIVTGKLLRLANSSQYNRGSEVTSVLSALQRVGLREVRAICVVLAVVDAFSKSAGLDHRRFWDHCAAVGRVAQLLHRKIPGSQSVSSDDVYVAGLLHDVGILLLNQFFPDRLKENISGRIATDAPLWRVEQDRMGVDHATVGGLLVQRWGLPGSIGHCVAAHHEPANAPEEFQWAARFVNAAETLCTSLGADAGVEGPADGDAFSVLADLGMPDREIDTFLGEIESIGISVRGALVV